MGNPEQSYTHDAEREQEVCRIACQGTQNLGNAGQVKLPDDLCACFVNGVGCGYDE
jgi:hypothetical protein